MSMCSFLHAITRLAPALCLLVLAGCESDDANEISAAPATATFRVRIENVSTSATLKAVTGASLAVPLSPGVWVLHTTPNPLFIEDTPQKTGGLEALAEDGAPQALAQTLPNNAGIVQVGTFTTPVGASQAQPIGPGQAYEFTFSAREGDRLSLATMFVPSNDLFFAPTGQGVALFADGKANSGDLTDRLRLWDAGTENNEPPGAGLEQAPTQPAPNTGLADPNALVRRVDDGFAYPEVGEVIRVTLTTVAAPTGGQPGDGGPTGP